MPASVFADPHPPVRQQAFQQISASVVTGGDCLALGDDRHDAFLNDSLEQRFLAVEIQVKRSLRYAGA